MGILRIIEGATREASTQIRDIGNSCANDTVIEPVLENRNTGVLYLDIGYLITIPILANIKLHVLQYNVLEYICY